MRAPPSGFQIQRLARAPFGWGWTALGPAPHVHSPSSSPLQGLLRFAFQLTAPRTQPRRGPDQTPASPQRPAVESAAPGAVARHASGTRNTSSAQSNFRPRRCGHSTARSLAAVTGIPVRGSGRGYSGPERPTRFRGSGNCVGVARPALPVQLMASPARGPPIFPARASEGHDCLATRLTARTIYKRYGRGHVPREPGWPRHRVCSVRRRVARPKRSTRGLRRVGAPRSVAARRQAFSFSLALERRPERSKERKEDLRGTKKASRNLSEG